MPFRIYVAICLASLFHCTFAGFAADTDPDEALLLEHKIAVDGPSLLKYFQERTLHPGDDVKLAALVRQLGSRSYLERESASRALIARGMAALPQLRSALNDADLEISRRAASGIAKIEHGASATLPAAAAIRLLARRKPDGAVKTLLNFAPAADDALEEELLPALLALMTPPAKIDPAFEKALSDANGIRRGAAAFVLGRFADRQPAVRKLLGDPDVKVRWRAARGLLA